MPIVSVAAASISEDPATADSIEGGSKKSANERAAELAAEAEMAAAEQAKALAAAHALAMKAAQAQAEAERAAREAADAEEAAMREAEAHFPTVSSTAEKPRENGRQRLHRAEDTVAMWSKAGPSVLVRPAGGHANSAASCTTVHREEDLEWRRRPDAPASKQFLPAPQPARPAWQVRQATLPPSEAKERLGPTPREADDEPLSWRSSRQQLQPPKSLERQGGPASGPQPTRVLLPPSRAKTWQGSESASAENTRPSSLSAIQAEEGDARRKLEAVIRMGYPAARAAEALTQSKGDVDRAVATLRRVDLGGSPERSARTGCGNVVVPQGWTPPKSGKIRMLTRPAAAGGEGDCEKRCGDGSESNGSGSRGSGIVGEGPDSVTYAAGRPTRVLSSTPSMPSRSGACGGAGGGTTQGVPSAPPSVSSLNLAEKLALVKTELTLPGVRTLHPEPLLPTTYMLQQYTPTAHIDPLGSQESPPSLLPSFLGVRSGIAHGSRGGGSQQADGRVRCSGAIACTGGPAAKQPWPPERVTDKAEML
jgi:hypothetical protein